jgi:hypothetical protein
MNPNSETLSTSEAAAGSHFVKVGLQAYQDPQETIIVDSFTFQLEVVEPIDGIDWGNIIVITIVSVSIISAVALIIRKRR